jgi:hypothetical protein
MIITLHLHYLIFSLGGIMLGSAVDRTNVGFMNYICGVFSCDKGAS